MPLRRQGTVVQAAATRRGVATQLPRDRRRVTTHHPSDLAHTLALSLEQGDLLTLGEGQKPARQRNQRQRRHTATLTKPAPTHRLRHTTRRRSLLARQTLGDPPPELPPHLPVLVHTWTPRRPQGRPARPRRRPTRRSSHGTPLDRGVATTTGIRPRCPCRCERSRRRRCRRGWPRPCSATLR